MEGKCQTPTETSIEEYHDFRMAASPLERIADHAQRIATVASKLQQPINGDVMGDIEDLNNAYIELVKQSLEALFDANTSLANQVIDSVDNMHLQIEELHASILKLESHEVMISPRDSCGQPLQNRRPWFQYSRNSHKFGNSGQMSKNSTG